MLSKEGGPLKGWASYLKIACLSNLQSYFDLAVFLGTQFGTFLPSFVFIPACS
jgi:hypothetical protein